MENSLGMYLNALIVMIFCLSLTGLAFSQEAENNLLEKVDIRFSLDGDPTPDDAGFSDPKSNWKIEYQLYLSDWDELKKLGRCGLRETPDSLAYCSGAIDKKFDKRLKKVSRFMAKGKLVRTQLSNDANREIIETVNFSPEVINAFNDAAKVYEKNPVFVFFVKTSLKTRTPNGKKFKKKTMAEGLHSLKIYKIDKTFDYWNLAKLSYSLTISKDKDGSLILRKSYTHSGQ